MANHFFSTQRGTGIHSLTAATADITAGTATVAGDDVEVRIADAAGLTKADVKDILERISQFIQNSSTFPIL